MKKLKRNNLLIILILSLPINNIYTTNFGEKLSDLLDRMDAQTAARITIGIGCILSAWALFEFYKRTKIEKTLSEKQERLNSSETELKLFKEDFAQMNAYVELIASIRSKIEEIKQEFKQEIAFWTGAGLEPVSLPLSSNYLKKICSIIQNHITKKGFTLSDYQNSISNELNWLFSMKEQLDLKKVKFVNNYYKTKNLNNKTSDLMLEIENLINLFFQHKALIDEQSYFIEVLLLDKNFEEIYEREIELFETSKSNIDTDLLNKHIFSVQKPEIAFPYYLYVKKVNDDKLLARNIIKTLSNLDLREFQKEYLTRAIYLEKILRNIFEILIVTSRYNIEAINYFQSETDRYKIDLAKQDLQHKEETERLNKEKEILRDDFDQLKSNYKSINAKLDEIYAEARRSHPPMIMYVPSPK